MTSLPPVCAKCAASVCAKGGVAASHWTLMCHTNLLAVAPA